MNPSYKQAAATLKMADDPELFQALEEYRKSVGWTQKRFWLMGAALIIERNGDSPGLVVKIANYLSGKR